MSGSGTAYFQGFLPYGYYPHGFNPQGFPTQASNTSKRNSTDGTSTDKDEGLDSIRLSLDEDTNDQVNPARLNKLGYSSAENEHLVKCWIDVSIDSIVGIDQKMDQMWMRIVERYNKNRPAGMTVRHWNTLKSHYYTLQKQTRWFCDCYNMIAKEWGSGKNDSDIIQMTQEEYKERHNKFGYKHIGVWLLLRECPKFANVDGDVHSKKKTKTSDSRVYTSSSANEDDGADRVRPIGQKATKMNANGKGKVQLLKEAKESMDEKSERAKYIVDIEEYKILMQDEDKIKPEKRAIHKKMLNKIKKK